MKVLKDPICAQRLKVQCLRAWTIFISNLLGDSRNISVAFSEKASGHIRMQSTVLVALSQSLHDFSSFDLRQELLDSVSVLSVKCAGTLSTLSASQLDILATLAVPLEEERSAEVRLAKEAESELERLVQRSDVRARSSEIAGEVTEKIFDLSRDLQRKPGLYEEDEFNRKLLRLEANLILLRHVEEARSVLKWFTYFQNPSKGTRFCGCTLLWQHYCLQKVFFSCPQFLETSPFLRSDFEIRRI